MTNRCLLTLNADRVIIGVARAYSHGDAVQLPLPPNVVEATAAIAALEPLLGRTLAADGLSVSEPPVPDRAVALRSFLLLFTPQEFSNAEELVKDNALLRYWQALLCAEATVNLSHPMVADALNVYRLAGVFGAASSPAALARVARILAGQRPE